MDGPAGSKAVAVRMAGSRDGRACVSVMKNRARRVGSACGAGAVAVRESSGSVRTVTISKPLLTMSSWQWWFRAAADKACP